MTTSDSISNFVSMNLNPVILATLRKMPDQIPDLAELMHTNVSKLVQVSKKSACLQLIFGSRAFFVDLQPIMPEILAYLTPSYADNTSMSSEYVVESTVVRDTLHKHEINIDQHFREHLSEIIIKLFDNLIDTEKMKQLVNIDFNLTRNWSNIDFCTLVTCLTYLKVFFR